MAQLAVDSSPITREQSIATTRDLPAIELKKLPFRPIPLLAFSLWIGLATGLLEVTALEARRHFVDPSATSALELNQHARWMIPVSHFVIFGACGIGLAILCALTRSRLLIGVGVYLLCMLSVLSLLWTYGGLTTLASTSLAAGATLWVAPCLLAHARELTRTVRFGIPSFLSIVAVFFSIHIGKEQIDTSRLPPAPPGAPNVLLVVLDTVRAQSLSLYGYGRDTSPRLAEFARRGVRFEHARTAAAWTLPSHASMFTGRWAYELSTRPDRPLDATFPTLAEFLREHGYATAGFAANTYFCSVWYGLGRGFMHYEDVAVCPLEIMRSSILGRYLVRKASLENTSRTSAYFERKDADAINGEMIDWLASRPKDRPFFAFLNYYDAHDPYLVPSKNARHFGMTPDHPQDLATLRDWLKAVSAPLPDRTLELARDGYDDCIAYLDERLGSLLSELDSRRILDNTVVIVTADHGELLGERGLFGHGQSLHREVVHVPLLVVAPHRVPSARVVSAPASLRELPATIVDLLGLSAQSPFPGRSLARHWRPQAPGSADRDHELIISETAEELSRAAPDATTGRSILDGNMLYIRMKDGKEQLFDVAADPAELHDLIGEETHHKTLAQFRAKMLRIDLEAETLESERRSTELAASPQPLPARGHAER
jgi:arylsulfatase A-like enzyme